MVPRRAPLLAALVLVLVACGGPEGADPDAGEHPGGDAGPVADAAPGADARVPDGGVDRDGDGYGHDVDCDDEDPEVHPGAPDLPDDADRDENCDGLDGDLGRAVFLSPTGSPTNDGLSPATPLSLLEDAVALATTLGFDVLVQGDPDGCYPLDASRAAITASIYGGYASDWRRTLAPADTCVAGAIFEGSAPLVADRLRLVASTAPPGDGPAVLSLAAQLTLRDCQLEAPGTVSSGENGAHGEAYPTPSSGAAGGAGAACAPASGGDSGSAEGGAAGASSCGAYCPQGGATAGLDGGAGPPGADAIVAARPCAVEGEPGDTLGFFDPRLVWRGCEGGTGRAGRPGQGGAGGGQGGGFSYDWRCAGCDCAAGTRCQDGTQLAGGVGGAGGTGGRGSRGGAGGKQGRASVGLVAVRGEVSLQDVTIVRGTGGDGGAGGDGAFDPGVDGDPGLGGSSCCLLDGGVCKTISAADGGRGGAGGDGGGSGGGSGGDGGPSIGVALLDGAALVGTSGTDYVVSGGAGGMPGTPGTGAKAAAAGAPGSPGALVEVQTYRTTNVGSVSGWPTLGRDPYRRGKTDVAGPPADVLRWTFTAGGPIRTSPAVAPDGTVYLGSDDKTVYALDGATGRALWSYTTQGPVRSSPTVARRALFVGSDSGTLYSFDRLTGGWYFQFASGAPVRSSPVAGADLTVYFSNQGGTVFAFDTTSYYGPVERWRFQASAAVSASLALGPGGTVLAADEAGMVYALDGPTGQQLWEHGVGAPVTATPVVGASGVLYVLTTAGGVHALDPASGVELWSESRTSATGLAMSDGTLLVTLLHGLNLLDGLTGGSLGGILDELHGAWYPPAIGTNSVYYPTDGGIYARDLSWLHALSGIPTQPAIGPDGSLYVAYGNSLHAFGP